MSGPTTPARRVSRILGPIVAITLLTVPLAAHAINCQLTVLPFNFGLYVPGDVAPLDITGSVDMRCMGTAGFFVVTLSPGTSGVYASRTMTSGPFVMAYNLYRNAGRTLVWGDGTGGSVPVIGFKFSPGRQDFALPLYGRVFPGQSVGAGMYADDILVTVIF